MPILALLPIITAIAPLAARLLGNAIDGKSGAAIAERVVQEVSGVAGRLFGTADPAAIEAALANDPNRSAEFARELNQLATQVQISTLQADLANVTSARAATLGAESAWVRAVPGILSVIIVAGFFGTLAVLVRGNFPGADSPAVRELLSLLLGALTLAFGDVRNFWLGSSAGSKRKDAALADQAQNAVRLLGQRANPAAPAVPAPPAFVMLPAAPPPAAPLPLAKTDGFRRQYPDGRGWRLTPAGLIIEGREAPERTVGAPTTVRRIWASFGPVILAASRTHGVPVELIVATIATETRGNPDARRVEPDGRISVGLMQTLSGTASQMLGRPVAPDELRDPALSVDAGTRYIRRQRTATEFQPPLVAAAYNAGSLRRSEKNRWKLVSTGDHIDRFCKFFNDACAVSQEDRWLS